MTTIETGVPTGTAPNGGNSNGAGRYQQGREDHGFVEDNQHEPAGPDDEEDLDSDDEEEVDSDDEEEVDSDDEEEVDSDDDEEEEFEEDVEDNDVGSDDEEADDGIDGENTNRKKIHEDQFEDEPDIEVGAAGGGSGAPPSAPPVLEQEASQPLRSGSATQPLRPGSQRRQLQMNPAFQDVEETGKWGKISRKEVLIVCAFLIVAIVAVVLGVVLTRDNGDDNNSEEAQEVAPPTPPTRNPTAAPTIPPTVYVPEDPNVGLTLLKTLTTPDGLTAIPQNITLDNLSGASSDPNQSPVQRAAGWVLLDDPAEVHSTSPHFLERFALATLFYSTNGQGWTNNEGWVTELTPPFSSLSDVRDERSHCSWYGIACNYAFLVQEIDLGGNNLVGTIPFELSNLKQMNSLVLRNNGLTGLVPESMIAASPTLSLIYLEGNEFTGTPSNLIFSNGVVSTLLLQYNNLTGIIPLTMCNYIQNDQKLLAFGLDCEEITCTCCDQDNQCF